MPIGKKEHVKLLVYVIMQNMYIIRLSNDCSVVFILQDGVIENTYISRCGQDSHVLYISSL
jgi:hypothetical protein